MDFVKKLWVVPVLLAVYLVIAGPQLLFDPNYQFGNHPADWFLGTLTGLFLNWAMPGEYKEIGLVIAIVSGVIMVGNGWGFIPALVTGIVVCVCIVVWILSQSRAVIRIANKR